MRRPNVAAGQTTLWSLLDTTLESPPAVTPSPTANPQPEKKPVKVPKPKPQLIVPSVTLHKKGRHLLIKANDILAADRLAEVEDRGTVSIINQLSYYCPCETGYLISGKDVTPLWRLLGKDLRQHSTVKALESFGVYVYISSTLEHYLQKEARRQALENAPFPFPQSESDVSLFDRAAEGTVLRCRQDFTPAGATHAVFHKDHRYMVVGVGGEGVDQVEIGTDPISDNVRIDLVGQGKRFVWTSFHQPMEDHFDDSEDADIGKTILELYPEQVGRMEKKLKALQLPLWEHVSVDSAMMALKRGVLNCYPMRMGKTSAAVTVARLSEAKKVFFIGPRNARLFTVKELKRLGFKEGEDFKVVDCLKDLEHLTSFSLMTYSWLRSGGTSGDSNNKQPPGNDPMRSARGNWGSILRPSHRTVRQKMKATDAHPNPGPKEYENVTVQLINNCPHCKEPLYRPDFYPNKDDMRGPLHTHWTRIRGYMCRNQDCHWLTDSRNAKGARWRRGYRTTHQGGYVDYTLAGHARCPDEPVRGRMCLSCKQADGVWKPGMYKRIKKIPTMVVADEIHACKDKKAEQAKATYALKPRRRMGLTGTLISNSPLDAYWPMHWATSGPSSLFPYAYGEGLKDFDLRFCASVNLDKPIGTEVDPETGEVKQLTKVVRKRIPFVKNPPDLWKFFAPKVIRRTYKDELFQKTLFENQRHMPEILPERAVCPMHPAQAKLMLASIKDFKQQYETMVKTAKDKGIQVNPALVISQMTTLRKAATCPEMLNEQFGEGVYTGPAGGGKIIHIQRIVEDKIKEGGKVLILSDFQTMQRTVASALKKYNPIRFQTEWDDDARGEAFEAFQLGDENKVFIAGTRAVREGVDLSAADTCICCDLLWSPAFQVQAWSRIAAPQDHARTCRVYLMLSKNSLDEHIFSTFYAKMVAAEQAMDRKVLQRKAQEFNVQWFVDRVLEEETAIVDYIREADPEMVAMPDLDLRELAEREV